MKRVKTATKLLKRKPGQLAIRFLPLIAPMLLLPKAETSHASGTIRKEHTVPVTIEYASFDNQIHDLYDGMGLQQTGLRFEVFHKALTGYLNLKSNHQLSEKPLLTIVDLELSSAKKRLWVIDLKQKDILYFTYATHGKNSGNEFATQFSNEQNSNMSSPGFYKTGDVYYGKHGLSLTLDGLDENFNSNARARNIVLHGAEYASETVIKLHGRLGRSQGCPAVPIEQHKAIINAVKENTCLFVNAPVKSYTSKYLNNTVAYNAFTKTNRI